MDENTNVMTENTEVVAQQEAPVAAATPEATKTGLTTGQKAVGLGVIGFAIFGLIQLIRLIIGGVKKIAAKFKKQPKVEAAPAAPAPEPVKQQTTTTEVNPEDIVSFEELPPEK